MGETGTEVRKFFASRDLGVNGGAQNLGSQVGFVASAHDKMLDRPRRSVNVVIHRLPHTTLTMGMRVINLHKIPMKLGNGGAASGE